VARPSKGDGPGTSAASFKARFQRAPQDDGLCAPAQRIEMVTASGRACAHTPHMAGNPAISRM